MKFLGYSLDYDKLIDTSLAMLDNIIWAILIFFIGKWVVGRIVNIMQIVFKRGHLDSTIANFLSNLLYGALLVVVILASLSQLGVNTNSFVAVLGGAAVAVGISLKDQLSNFAAGIMIVIFRPFNRGDLVEINGKMGTVHDITLINTRLQTANNHEIIIPNSDFTTNAVINYSLLPKRRVDVKVGISYDADIKKAKHILLQLAQYHPKVLQEPEAIVRVTNLGESAVELTLNVWSENGDWADVQFDLLEEIKYAFDNDGIELPYPQRNLHIEGLDNIIKSQIKQ